MVRRALMQRLLLLAFVAIPHALAWRYQESPTVAEQVSDWASQSWAYFVDNINLSDIGALVEIASGLRLDGNLARQVLEQRYFREAVDADWERARQLGITGVPTFYKNDLAVVGCQPYETLERFVKHLTKT